MDVFPSQLLGGFNEIDKKSFIPNFNSFLTLDLLRTEFQKGRFFSVKFEATRSIDAELLKLLPNETPTISIILSTGAVAAG